MAHCLHWRSPARRSPVNFWTGQPSIWPEARVRELAVRSLVACHSSVRRGRAQRLSQRQRRSEHQIIPNVEQPHGTPPGLQQNTIRPVRVSLFDNNSGDVIRQQLSSIGAACVSRQPIASITSTSGTISEVQTTSKARPRWKRGLLFDCGPTWTDLT